MMDGDVKLHPGFPPPIEDDFIPAEYYTGPEVAAAEKARLWPRIWHMVCREEDIPRVGDFVTYEIYQESVLVVRSAAAEVKAFYNACQHRGRRLRDDAAGHLSSFYCRFHGWRYNLDGSIAHVHFKDDWAQCPGFRDEKLGLKPVRVGHWGGWIWINMDPDAPELLDYLGVAAQRLDPFELDKLRRVWDVTIYAEVNWKVVVEAFIEGYHATATHISGVRYLARQPGVPHGEHGMYFAEWSESGPYLNAAGNWVEPKTPQEGVLAHARHIYDQLRAMTLEPHMAAAERLVAETPPDLPPAEIGPTLWRLHQEEFARRGLEWPQALTPEAVNAAGTSWHMFPNTIVLPTPDGALWYRFRPDGDDPTRSIFDIWCFGRVPPGEEPPKVERQVFQGLEAARDANPFLAEDFDNMIAVQKGMESRGWEGARVNPCQEMLVTNFHRVLDRYIRG